MLSESRLQAIMDTYSEDGSNAAAQFVPSLVEACREANRQIHELRIRIGDVPVDAFRHTDIGDGF